MDKYLESGDTVVSNIQDMIGLTYQHSNHVVRYQRLKLLRLVYIYEMEAFSFDFFFPIKIIFLYILESFFFFFNTF